jgi:DNA-directed RNA polymerase specialized sigma24 family protein
MADTFAAAFAEIAGPEFDLATGFDVQRPERTPTPADVAEAFIRFNYDEHIARVTSMIVARWRDDRGHAEEAVQEALAELYERRLYLFHMPPESWMGLLYKAALHWCIKLRKHVDQVDSIEGLAEMAGDAALAGARPVLPAALENVDEDAKYTPPPGPGERWERLQMIGAAQRFRDHFGRPPTADEHSGKRRKALGLPPSSAVDREFGSYASYLLEAGMTPRYMGRPRGQWDDPVKAARTVLAWRRRNGYWPARPEIERTANGLPGKNACEKLFGGVKAHEIQQGVESILGSLEAAKPPPPTISGTVPSAGGLTPAVV